MKLWEQIEIKIMQNMSKEMACVHAHYPLTHDSVQFALFSKKKKEKEGEGSKKTKGLTSTENVCLPHRRRALAHFSF